MQAGNIDFPFRSLLVSYVGITDNPSSYGMDLKNEHEQFGHLRKNVQVFPQRLIIHIGTSLTAFPEAETKG